MKKFNSLRDVFSEENRITIPTFELTTSVAVKYSDVNVRRYNPFDRTKGIAKAGVFFDPRYDPNWTVFD